MGIPLDEVTSALDADAIATVGNVILELNREGITILWVTHSDTQSRKCTNKRLTIENGQLKSPEAANAILSGENPNRIKGRAAGFPCGRGCRFPWRHKGSR